MTIQNYTFFSLHGNDFPVTANSDGKLYMMLTGMNYNDLRIKHWSPAVSTALNRVYINTSLVVGGRYFELRDHSVILKPAQTNYIHAVITVGDMENPVTITAEDSNMTNSADINNTSNVLKVCFETIVTGGSAITTVIPMTQVTTLDQVTVKRIETTSDVRSWTPITLNNVTSAVLMYKIINGVIHLNGQGNWGSFTANQSKTVATLPNELRPTRTVNKIITTQNTNNNDKPMEIQFQEGGNVNIWSMPASTGGRYGGFEESYPLG
jgi:hypothetical protein